MHYPADRIPTDHRFGVRRRTLIACLMLAPLFRSAVMLTAVADDPPPPDYRSVQAMYRAELEQLAAKCDELGLAAQARVTRAWQRARDPRRQYVFRLGDSNPDAPEAAAKDLVKFWYERFLQLRRVHAQRLWELAQSSLRAGQAARAYQLLHEVLREDPDHATVTRILRWPRRQRRVTARTRLDAHQKFGWGSGQHWRIESQHFQINTNYDSEEAVELAGRLEQLYDVWQQVFFESWSNKAVLERAIRNQSPMPTPSRRLHKIVLFRDHDEYLAALSRYAPRRIASHVGNTIGIYLYGEREAWFYGSPKNEPTTWIHEVTHQLFHEAAGKTAATVGGRDNFWIVEGIAMYMESLQYNGSFWTLGGFESDRLQRARFLANHDQFFVPLRELAAMSSEDIQGDRDRIYKLYSQSAGMAHFLMDFEDGAYRPVAVDYLKMVYAGRCRDDSLERLVGEMFERLDQQYREFLQVRDVDLLAYLDQPEQIRQLALGGTEVTDAGLAALAECSQLESLDLTRTKTTDAGLAHLAGLTKLSELGLVQTQVTNAGLVHLRDLKQLDSLNVLGTKVTTDGLSELAQSLPNLKLDDK